MIWRQSYIQIWILNVSTVIVHIETILQSWIMTNRMHHHFLRQYPISSIISRIRIHLYILLIFRQLLWFFNWCRSRFFHDGNPFRTRIILYLLYAILILILFHICRLIMIIKVSDHVYIFNRGIYLSEVINLVVGLVNLVLSARSLWLRSHFFFRFLSFLCLIASVWPRMVDFIHVVSNRLDISMRSLRFWWVKLLPA